MNEYKDWIVRFYANHNDIPEGHADGGIVGELIRCKDCKHYDGYYCHNKWWGDGHGNYTPPIKGEDGFCDWAERKEE